MRLEFLKLTMVDFKAFSGEHTFALDLPAGLYRVKGRNLAEPRLGSNGAGKSTLWDAIMWCLYGKTVGGLRNPDIKRWKGPKQSCVSLRVRINGKRTHTVERTTSPNALTIDGDDVGQEAVERLVRMSFELMANTIILGQGRPLFFDMEPGRKMKLLTDARDLDRWDARSKRASELVTSLGLEKAKYEGEVVGLERSLEEISSELKELKPKQAAWQEQFETRLAEAAAFERKHGARIAKLQRLVDKADLAYDGAMTEVKSCEAQTIICNNAVQEARRALDAMRDRRERAQAGYDDCLLKFTYLGKARLCPTCNQTVTSKNLAKHREEVHHEMKRHEDVLLGSKTGKLKSELDRLMQRESRMAKALGAFHKAADDALRDHKKHNAELTELNERLRQIKKATDQGEDNPYTSQIRSLRKRASSLKTDLEGARSDITSVEREIEQTKFWIKGFKEIKLHVIEELLQELELTTAAMLEEVGLIGWRVRYSIERETKSGKTQRALSIMIGSPRSKGLVKWESWSGGEAQRLRLVGALALAAVLLDHAGVSSSVEVLDEPIMHLSDEGVHDLIDYLADRASSMGRAIFYCDHQSVESVKFAGSITVRRDDDGSRIGRLT